MARKPAKSQNTRDLPALTYISELWHAARIQDRACGARDAHADKEKGAPS
jgi:hypothetical protein